MKKSVKILSLILAICMAVCVFAACGGKTNNDPSGTPADTKDAYTVGICQLVQHDALDAATKGFQEKLTELMTAAGKTVTFDYQNASGESANCATIINQFVSNKADLIMANATPALQAAATATVASKTPVVAVAITDFGEALDIDMAATDPTGINVTGASDYVSSALQAAQILDLFPDTKVVGCIYCSAEANSLFQVEGMKAALAEKNVECNFYSFADTNDVQAVTKKAAEESDVIYVPTDNTAASNGAIIADACIAAETPIVAGEEGIFNNTKAVATLTLSYYQNGVSAAEQAYEILVNGKDPAEINISQVSSEDLVYYYNAEMVEKYTIYRRLQIFLRICNAVDFAHSRHCCHLDIKPSNVLWRASRPAGGDFC